MPICHCRAFCEGLTRWLYSPNPVSPLYVHTFDYYDLNDDSHVTSLMSSVTSIGVRGGCVLQFQKFGVFALTLCLGSTWNIFDRHRIHLAGNVLQKLFCGCVRQRRLIISRLNRRYPRFIVLFALEVCCIVH
jgi:hypothetical protein